MSAFNEFIKKFPIEIQELFGSIVDLLKKNVPSVEEKLWAGLPSFYVDKSFVRIIPFKDHLNIEACALADFKDNLQGYKFTPKNMLQIYVGQNIPSVILTEVFIQTLA